MLKDRLTGMDLYTEIAHYLTDFNIIILPLCQLYVKKTGKSGLIPHLSSYSPIKSVSSRLIIFLLT
ncbi:hypothetical protein MMC2321_03626 [Chitinophaga sp. MM2321]